MKHETPFQVPSHLRSATDVKHFYKYKYIDEDHLEYSSRIFTDHELHFSSVNDFNDPFDCTFKADSNCSGAEADRRRFYQSMLEKYDPSLDSHTIQEAVDAAEQHFGPGVTKFLDKRSQDLILAEARRWGLYCLSAVPNNILMWAHYANAHQGFCLQFLNEQGQPFRIKPNPGERGETPEYLDPVPVRYSNQYPVVNFNRDERMTMVRKTCFTKARQWIYEEEWRMVDINGPGPHQFSPQCLTGVIFGCRMSEEHKKLIRDWCKDRQPAITYYEAKQSEDSYSLNIVEIS